MSPLTWVGMFGRTGSIPLQGNTYTLGDRFWGWLAINSKNLKTTLVCGCVWIINTDLKKKMVDQPSNHPTNHTFVHASCMNIQRQHLKEFGIENIWNGWLVGRFCFSFKIAQTDCVRLAIWTIRPLGRLANYVEWVFVWIRLRKRFARFAKIVE